MATGVGMAVEAAIVNAHGKHAQAVHFLHDGKHLVSAGQDAFIRIWTVPDLKAAGELEGHKNSVNSLSFSPDEKLLLTGSTDKTVRLWDFPKRSTLQTFP